MVREWITQAPPPDLLVAERNDERPGRRNDTVIIIPSYRDSGMLTKHLSLLSKQTTKEFDIIIIYGNEDRFAHDPKGLNLLHIRPHDNIGCAGSFYIGERIALDEGYSKIILADDDCLPESDDLIESLMEKLDTEAAAAPKIRLRPSDRICNGIIHHYGAMRRETLESTGLSYFPFFLGGEDFDLMRRIGRIKLKIATVGSVASHPLWPPIFIWETKKIHSYSRGNIVQLLIGKDIIRGSISLAIHLQTGVALSLLGKRRQARVYFVSAWEASQCRLGQVPAEKDRIEPIAAEQEGRGVQSDGIIIKPRNQSRDMETDAFLQIERKSAIPEVLSRLRKSIYENGAIISSFNKDVLFDGFCNIRDIPLILVARGSSIRFERRVYSITKSRQPWSIALGVIIFGLAAPISISAGFILALRGISNALIHNIRSEGYGIPRK